MAVTNYVSTTGSNTSPYDTWAKAATNPNSAIALWTAGGGNRTIMAPGKYSFALTPGPPYDGASGSWNEIEGDVKNAYGNGTTGEVCLDTFTTGWTTMKPCVYLTQGADYLRFKGITINPTAGTIDAAAGCLAVYNTRCDNFEFLDGVCISIGTSGVAAPPMWFKTSTTPSGTRIVNVMRSLFIHNCPSAIVSEFASASAAFQATPDLFVHKCQFITGSGSLGEVYFPATTNSYYNYAKMYGCNIFTRFESRTTSVMHGANSTYAKGHVERCEIMGYKAGAFDTVTAGTNTNNGIMGRTTAPTGFTRRITPVIWPNLALINGSSLKGILSDDPQSGALYGYDIAGRDISGGGNTTPGANQKYGVELATFKNSRGMGYPKVDT